MNLFSGAAGIRTRYMGLDQVRCENLEQKGVVRSLQDQEGVLSISSLRKDKEIKVKKRFYRDKTS